MDSAPIVADNYARCLVRSGRPGTFNGVTIYLQSQSLDCHFPDAWSMPEHSVAVRRHRPGFSVLGPGHQVFHLELLLDFHRMHWYFTKFMHKCN